MMNYENATAQSDFEKRAIGLQARPESLPGTLNGQQDKLGILLERMRDIQKMTADARGRIVGSMPPRDIPSVSHSAPPQGPRAIPTSVAARQDDLMDDLRLVMESAVEQLAYLIERIG